MFIGLSLSITGQLRAGGFSVASLFAGSEEGVWYDPSDLTTLFQDVTGTDPVTTAGQTVALMLDKSQGLTLGPDVVGPTWTIAADAGWSQVGSDLVSVNGANFSAYQPILTLGKTYEVQYEVYDYVSGTVSVRTGASGVTVNYTANGVYTVRGVATDTSLYFMGFVTFNGKVRNISVRELPGNHATQATAASRPTYQVSGGLGYLSFDGTDDGMVTPTITPGVDKAQVFAGVRKLSDAARGTVIEHSASIAANNGGLHLTAPNAASATFAFESKGTTLTDAVDTGLAAPTTCVLAGLGDISGDSATLRIDGVQEAQNTGDQGTGNYLAYPMYIGRRAGTGLPFNGHIYGLVTRFGANLDADVIDDTEAYIAGKTGVTL